jgi:hypothetical protein
MGGGLFADLSASLQRWRVRGDTQKCFASALYVAYEGGDPVVESAYGKMQSWREEASGQCWGGLVHMRGAGGVQLAPPSGKKPGLVGAENCDRVLPSVIYGQKTELLGGTRLEMDSVGVAGVARKLDFHAVLVRPEIGEIDRPLGSVGIKESGYGKCRALLCPGPVLYTMMEAGTLIQPGGAITDSCDTGRTRVAAGITQNAAGSRLGDFEA